MINVGSNYNLVNDLLSKNNGVFIGIDEYERYGNQASQEMFDDFLGIKTQPRIVYGKNRLVDERLRVFRRVIPLSFVNETLTIPDKARNFTAIYTSVGKIPVKPIDEDRYARIFDDPLASPNEQDKYYLENDTTLTLLGESSLNVKVHYLAKPTPIVYAYTMVNNRPVYNDINSTHYEWDSHEESELTSRILIKAGMSMRDVMALQLGNTNKDKE